MINEVVLQEKKKHMRKYSNKDLRHRSPNEDVFQGKKKTYDK